eukprot:4125996-Pleurochrysis_carterae.AAC.2
MTLAPAGTWCSIIACKECDDAMLAIAVRETHALTCALVAHTSAHERAWMHGGDAATAAAVAEVTTGF